MDFIAEVLRVAGELGLAPWERIVLILAAALLIVIGGRLGFGRVWKHLRSIEIKDPELSPPMDVPEGGMPVPGKEWRDEDFTP